MSLSNYEKNRKPFLADSFTHKDSTPYKMRKLWETSNLQNGKIKYEATTHEANVELRELLKKCKSKYRMEFKVDLDSQFYLEKDRNIKLIVRGIKEELLYIQSLMFLLKEYQN
ncbi:hypothetical protein RF11_11308 [Thelohanellus kitauei]|uniref:Uncharacterized protein n=1 Tax=Thelohanellus kitauei TaxID=669202 RepID=A0A0C2I7N9_THEKT|nr:hypothetical protein RF11_11308 [Thelohanellus kitauei]